MQRHASIAQDVARALGVELQAVAARHDLGGQHLGLGLARLGDDALDEFLFALEQHAHGPLQHVGALAEAALRPLRLGLARAVDGRANLLGAIHLELREEREGGGVGESEPPPRARRGLHSLHQCHRPSPQVLSKAYETPWGNVKRCAGRCAQAVGRA